MNTSMVTIRIFWLKRFDLHQKILVRKFAQVEWISLKDNMKVLYHWNIRINHNLSHILLFSTHHECLTIQHSELGIDKPKVVSQSQMSKADDLVFIKIAMSNHPPTPIPLGKFQRSKIELYFQNKSF